MGKVRIIGGLHRSRVLKFKDSETGLRPTPDRVRVTLFNWLSQDLTGKSCLDLFAGSGALGFEALSRNARSVIMIEKNKSVAQDLFTNMKLLNISNLQIKILDSLEYLKRLENKIDILFLDPPFNTTLLNDCLQLIVKSKDKFKDTLIYIEYSNATEELLGFDIIKQAKAGNVAYALIKCV